MTDDATYSHFLVNWADSGEACHAFCTLFFVLMSDPNNRWEEEVFEQY